MTMDNAFGFVVSRKETILRYVLAMPLLIPVAWLLTLDIAGIAWGMAFVVLGPDPGGLQESIPGLGQALVFFCWAVLLYWATSTDSIDRTVTRAFWAFCTGVFLLPVVGVTTVIFGPPDPSDQIIPKWVFMIGFFVVGVPLGFLVRRLARSMAPKGSPEESGGIWYVFKPIGGGYLVLAVGLLLIGATVLRLAGYEGLLS